VVGREAGPHPSRGQRNTAESTHAAEYIAAAVRHLCTSVSGETGHLNSCLVLPSVLLERLACAETELEDSRLLIMTTDAMLHC